MKRQIWKYVAIALPLVLLVGIGIVKAQTRTVSWTPVTEYTDGTPIEAGNAVTYSIWQQDNVTGTIVHLANRVSATSVTFDDASLVKGRGYRFWAQTHLASGASSDNSPVTPWTVPLGKAKYPVLVVQ